VPATNHGALIPNAVSNNFSLIASNPKDYDKGPACTHSDFNRGSKQNSAVGSTTVTVVLPRPEFWQTAGTKPKFELKKLGGKPLISTEPVTEVPKSSPALAVEA
jgi:hypothetical protein